MTAPVPPLDPTQIRKLLTGVAMPTRRWLTLLKDSEAFINKWLSKARALEWTDQDLWAVDPMRPFNNRDAGRSGLVIVLAGRPVLGIQNHCAVISNGVGDQVSHQIYQKGLQRASSFGPRLRLIWENYDVGDFSSEETLSIENTETAET